MKKTFLIIALFFSISLIAYSQTNMQKGFHIALDVSPRFAPDLDVYFNLSFYYRFMSDVFFVYLLDNTKTDLGIFNNFTLRKNISGIYVDSTPASFFSLYMSGAFIKYHDAIKKGLYVFGSLSSVANRDDITNASLRNSYGFLANVKPSFRIDIMKMIINKEGLVFISSLDVQYAYMMDSGNYFYDYSTYLLRRSEDISYTLNALVLFDYKPISVGVDYYLTYVQFANLFSQQLSGYAYYELQFLRNFYLTLKLNIGQFISHPYMAGKLYFNFSSSLSYKL